ncbi:MAG: T9SS type A sorting domain-containing protein [Fibrobacteria bacterium]|nr:T9SS type A sorting domain-containing protein [Fibrobacteria bacterium]
MTRFLIVFLCVFLPISAMALDYTFPGATWETKTAAEVGMSQSAVDKAASDLGGNGAIIRYGYVVKSWGSGGLAASTDWASSCKPVFSFLVWKAIKDGKINSFNDLVSDIITDKTFNAKDARISLWHLAHMMSGWDRKEDAGRCYAYNDKAINLYGMTVYNYIYKNSGNSPSEVLKSELSMLQFENNPNLSSSQIGRFSSVSVGDVGRMAHLFLNDGVWNGTRLIEQGMMHHMMHQVVPEDVPMTEGDATASFDAGTLGGSDYQSEGNNGPGSYSYNWWLNKHKKLWPDLDENVFQGNGHWGRENYTVFPDQQLIVIHYGRQFNNSQTNPIYKALVAGVTSDPATPPNPILPDSSTIDTDPTEPTNPVYLNLVFTNSAGSQSGPWLSSNETGDEDMYKRPILTVHYTTNTGVKATKRYQRRIGGNNPLMYFIADSQNGGNFYDQPDGTNYHGLKYGDAMLIKAGGNRIGFFKCEISSIPGGSTIDSVNFKGWVEPEGRSGSITISVWKGTADWKKTTISKSIQNYKGTKITDFNVTSTTFPSSNFWSWDWDANMLAYAQEQTDKLVSTKAFEKNNSQSIQVYSNPVSTGLNLIMPVFTGIGKLKIFDNQGSELQEAIVNSGETFIWNAHSNPAGVYFAELSFEGKSIRSKLTLMR